MDNPERIGNIGYTRHRTKKKTKQTTYTSQTTNTKSNSKMLDITLHKVCST